MLIAVLFNGCSLISVRVSSVMLRTRSFRTNRRRWKRRPYFLMAHAMSTCQWSGVFSMFSTFPFIVRVIRRHLLSRLRRFPRMWKLWRLMRYGILRMEKIKVGSGKPMIHLSGISPGKWVYFLMERWRNGWERLASMARYLWQMTWMDIVGVFQRSDASLGRTWWLRLKGIIQRHASSCAVQTSAKYSIMVHWEYLFLLVFSLIRRAS